MKVNESTSLEALEDNMRQAFEGLNPYKTVLQVARLHALAREYKLLSEVDELLGRHSKHRGKAWADSRQQQVLDEIESLRQSLTDA